MSQVLISVEDFFSDISRERKKIRKSQSQRDRRVKIMNGPDLLGKLRDSTLQSLLKDKPRPPGDFSSPENRAKLRERMEALRQKYNLPPVFLQCFFVWISDSLRSCVNVRDGWGADGSQSERGWGTGHLLNQQVAIPIRVGVTSGESLGYKEYSEIHVLTLATNKGLYNNAPRDIGPGSECNEPVCLDLDKNTVKACHAPAPCSCRRQNGAHFLNLVGIIDPPSGTLSKSSSSGWNQNGSMNSTRMAMFGCCGVTNGKIAGFVEHAQLEDVHKGLCLPSGARIAKGGGAHRNQTCWDQVFGSQTRPSVQDVWKIYPIQSRATLVTAVDVVNALALCAKPGYQSNEDAHNVLPVIYDFFHSGGMLAFSSRNAAGAVNPKSIGAV